MADPTTPAAGRTVFCVKLQKEAPGLDDLLGEPHTRLMDLTSEERLDDGADAGSRGVRLDAPDQARAHDAVASAHLDEQRERRLGRCLTRSPVSFQAGSKLVV